MRNQCDVLDLFLFGPFIMLDQDFFSLWRQDKYKRNSPLYNNLETGWCFLVPRSCVKVLKSSFWKNYYMPYYCYYRDFPITTKLAALLLEHIKKRLGLQRQRTAAGRSYVTESAVVLALRKINNIRASLLLYYVYFLIAPSRVGDQQELSGINLVLLRRTSLSFI